jgi:hypothetical protein
MTANTGAMLALNFLYGIGRRKTKANRPKKAR